LDGHGDDLAIVEVFGSRVLGGHGLRPTAGSVIDVAFSRTDLTLYDGRTALDTIRYRDVSALEIGGPGEVRSGGGFVGGGFGVAGVAGGMLLASALNMLTTTTRISTVLCLQTANAELFLHNAQATPDTLRMQLSAVFSILRQQQSPPPVSQDSPDDKLARLTQLAELLDKGLVTDDEFAGLKAEILAR
jgi:hypothetical protein